MHKFREKEEIVIKMKSILKIFVQISTITAVLFMLNSCGSRNTTSKGKGSSSPKKGSSWYKDENVKDDWHTSSGRNKKPRKEKQNTSSNDPLKSLSKDDEQAAQKVIKTAKSYIGTKYKFGGNDKKGIDCSGLICASYRSAGLELPRTSNEQSKIGKRVYIGELEEGDLVFFGATPGSKKITHVGVVSSVNGDKVKFIHAATSTGVIENEIDTYYRPRYIMATRPLKP